MALTELQANRADNFIRSVSMSMHDKGTLSSLIHHENMTPVCFVRNFMKVADNIVVVEAAMANFFLYQSFFISDLQSSVCPFSKDFTVKNFIDLISGSAYDYCDSY